VLVERVPSRPPPAPARDPRPVSLPPPLASRYLRLVAEVALRIDAALGPGVAANRVAIARADPPALALRPWRRERAAFVRRLSSMAGRARCLAIADVRACYPSIAPHAVERTLARLDVTPRSAAEIGRFLEGLAAAGIRGLPIGPDPSAVLANAVLSGVDRAVSDRALDHLRWVDDVVIACRDPAEARTALELVRRALADVGLEPNERKTRIVTDPRALAARPDVSGARGGEAVG
jgi:hypothetical protein